VADPRRDAWLRRRVRTVSNEYEPRTSCQLRDRERERGLESSSAVA